MTEQAVVQWVTDLRFTRNLLSSSFLAYGPSCARRMAFSHIGVIWHLRMSWALLQVAVAFIGSAVRLHHELRTGTHVQRIHDPAIMASGFRSTTRKYDPRAALVSKPGALGCLSGSLIPGVRNLIGYVAGASKLRNQILPGRRVRYASWAASLSRSPQLHDWATADSRCIYVGPSHEK